MSVKNVFFLFFFKVQRYKEGWRYRKCILLHLHAVSRWSFRGFSCSRLVQLYTTGQTPNSDCWGGWGGVGQVKGKGRGWFGIKSDEEKWVLKKISTQLTLDVNCLILRQSPSVFLGGTRWWITLASCFRDVFESRSGVRKTKTKEKNLGRRKRRGAEEGVTCAFMTWRTSWRWAVMTVTAVWGTVRRKTQQEEETIVKRLRLSSFDFLPSNTLALLDRWREQAKGKKRCWERKSKEKEAKE